MKQDVFGWQLELDRPWDFGLIRHYGAPFSLRIRRETGVLFFGVDSPQYGRLDIRYAGAPLADAFPPREAAAGLETAVSLYRQLYAHPALVKLQGHGAAAGGYLAVFRWEEGFHLGDAQARKRLMRMPLLTRLRMADSIFDFHLYAKEHGILPAGLWEDSLKTDPDTGTVHICDIDRYRMPSASFADAPLYGSGRLIPPEAYASDAPFDGTAAQYTLGAAAFLFFDACGTRERADWTAGEKLYRVAEKACRDRREDRYPSLEDFVRAWRKAAGETTV